jgi:hypothetical protein
MLSLLIGPLLAPRAFSRRPLSVDRRPPVMTYKASTRPAPRATERLLTHWKLLPFFVRDYTPILRAASKAGGGLGPMNQFILMGLGVLPGLITIAVVAWVEPCIAYVEKNGSLSGPFVSRESNFRKRLSS